MENNKRVHLKLLPEVLAVCQLAPEAAIPSWVWQSSKSLLSISYSLDELSVICEARVVPEGVRCEPGWRAIKVQGPLDFSLTGILAALATPLALSGIPIFAISTFDTDYILVKEAQIKQAQQVLEQAGHTFE
jgi:hypothetical protein